ncbi:hypothetical protein L596_021533 [Steinernema carpocapsae]|uniref:Uncharacterized protein n=1 Tax=Steinernema carpocapsae TaxID=34508 RepID=A0A4U5MJ07_STECR|nr:hypothetical protein L596_021533 [Steinernema carpocapsae]
MKLKVLLLFVFFIAATSARFRFVGPALQSERRMVAWSNDDAKPQMKRPLRVTEWLRSLGDDSSPTYTKRWL